MENRENKKVWVPESEVRVEFARASGSGGQNVNRRETKVVLFWHIASSSLTEEQKQSVREVLGNRINSEDELFISVDSERRQERNREIAFSRLQELVARALKPKKERKPTKVSYSEKKRRLEDKRKRGETKKLRGPVKDID